MARKLTVEEDRAHQRVHGCSEWRRNRVEALELAGYGCEVCGATNERLDVHHIMPPWYGGSHTLANLQVLCVRHHRLAHSALDRGFINGLASS